jgi:hypothetical protein
MRSQAKIHDSTVDEKELQTLALARMESWRSLSDVSTPMAQAPQNPQRHGSLPLKRPRNQACTAASEAEQGTSADPTTKRWKLDLDNPTIPINSTSCTQSGPAKEPHPQLIKARQSAYTIQEKGKLREPGACYQCQHKRTLKGSEFPTCRFAVDGRKKRCGWCTHQQQPYTDEKPKY